MSKDPTDDDVRQTMERLRHELDKLRELLELQRMGEERTKEQRGTKEGEDSHLPPSNQGSEL